MDNDFLIDFGFGGETYNEIKDCKLDDLLNVDHNENIDGKFNALFIPSKEVLTIFKGIRYLESQKFQDFNDTYFDLVNIIGLPFKPEIEDYMNPVIRMIEGTMNGSIEQKTKGIENFLYKSKTTGHEYQMQLTAEGIKQIGVLSMLLKNRELRRKTILFLDEPDTNLNPVAIRKFCEVIVELSKLGIQIFIASHSYFVIKQLNIYAKSKEYKEDVSINCYSLNLNSNGMVDISCNDLKENLPPNAIVEQALAMYSEEIDQELDN